jgi:hypothetical protein
MALGKIFGLAKDSFIKCIGDIKVFGWPLFLLYDPGSYLVKGGDMRTLIHALRPGDILVRGYKNYLDGYLIPGYFSHVGLYLGEVKIEDIQYVDPRGTATFKAGEQMVIHSMAEGVFMEDVLSFCFCDYMAVLRFPVTFFKEKDTVLPEFLMSVFTDEEKHYIDSLSAGQTLNFETVWPAIYRLALLQLGKRYDFSFDFTNFNDLSCSEFVYFCTKSLWWCLGSVPQKKRFLFFSKEILAPDAFVASRLQLIWHSLSTDVKELEKLTSIYAKKKEFQPKGVAESFPQPIAPSF